MADNLFISTSKVEEPIVHELNDIIRNAINERVADVHFQVTDQLCRIRFRMPGGLLIDYKTIKREWMIVFDEKIRSRARLSVTDRIGMQDGRISLTIDGINVDLRVAISPGVSGSQLIVCRLLNQSNSNMRLADVMMTSSVREAFEKLLHEPNGLFLVTGPTGSGKTTTLYSLLNELNDGTRNIITLENPVEYRIPQFHQINVDGNMVTFAGALRNVLRQDPDVILIGEIRDEETADIAVQAAITGHLVLSTLHANNAAMAITRMVEFGVNPYVLSAALRGVTAQRLIRRLNPAAEGIERKEPSDIEKAWLRANNIQRPNASYPYSHNKVDYKGFVPVMEVIIADARVKKSFNTKSEEKVNEIYAAASRQPQFETLAQAAERLAFTGVTTLNEACMISSILDAPSIKNRRLGQVLVESEIISSEDMEALLSIQADRRKEGSYQRLGKMLLDGDFCTQDDLMDAIGFTAEALDVLTRLSKTEDQKVILASLVQRWTPGVDSLFRLAQETNLVSLKDIHDAITV